MRRLTSADLNKPLKYCDILVLKGSSVTLLLKAYQRCKGEVQKVGPMLTDWLKIFRWKTKITNALNC